MNRFPFCITGKSDGLYILICQMFESSLLFQVGFHIGKFFWLVIQRKLAVFVFGKIPKPTIYHLFCNLHRFIRGDSPTGRTGRNNVDIFRSFDFRRFFHLAHKVGQIADACSGCIGNTVGGDNLKHIFLLLQISANILSRRRCRRFRTERSQRAFLNAGVHICLVVVADIQDIVVTVDGAGQCLQADICCSTVSGKSNCVEIINSLCPESRFYTCQHGCGSGKGGNDCVISET
ncbi:hypothetical protein IMSAG013_00179 [Clostridiales bacterium]|nr:hypothetical protein IMSAG013_00179 [Clostridiales bacterium]